MSLMRHGEEQSGMRAHMLAEFVAHVVGEWTPRGRSDEETRAEGDRGVA